MRPLSADGVQRRVVVAASKLVLGENWPRPTSIWRLLREIPREIAGVASERLTALPERLKTRHS